MGSANSGLVARLTFAASSPQNWPAERKRMSLDRNSQLSTPAVAPTFSLSSTRDFAPSSLRNCCCGPESGIESVPKSFGPTKQIKLTAQKNRIEFKEMGGDGNSRRIPRFFIAVSPKKAPKYRSGI